MGSLKGNEFKCYLEEEGEKCLSDYQTRRSFVAKLLTTINDSDDPPTSANSLLMDILDYHWSKVKKNGMQCDHLGVHNCLYVVAKLCVSSKLINTEEVCKLLTEINWCEMSFTRLTSSLILDKDLYNFVVDNESNSFICYDPEETDLEAVEYFLDESTKGKQLYWSLTEDLTAVEKKKVRFADVRRLGDGTPVCAAVFCHNFDLLLLLLRYGADLSSPKSPRGVYPAIVRTIKLITCSSKWYTKSNVYDDWYSVSYYMGTEKMWFEKKYGFYFNMHGPLFTSFTKYEEFQRESPYTLLLTCFRYLLRAVPFICVKTWQNSQESSFLGEDCCVNILHPRLAEDNILPANRYKEPAELEHLCRCCIRNCLHDNWKLPHGIYELQLPDILKQYLDLQFD